MVAKAKVIKEVKIGNSTIKIYDVFGVPIVNTTPHEITFRQDNEDIVVPPGDIVINAKPVETVVRVENGIQFVRTEFVADPATEQIVDEIAKTGAIIIGSVIAARAYDKVVAMTPAPGFERVKTEEKRMNPRKFMVF